MGTEERADKEDRGEPRLSKGGRLRAWLRRRQETRQRKRAKVSRKIGERAKLREGRGWPSLLEAPLPLFSLDFIVLLRSDRCLWPVLVAGQGIGRAVQGRSSLVAPGQPLGLETRSRQNRHRCLDRRCSRRRFPSRRHWRTSSYCSCRHRHRRSGSRRPRRDRSRYWLPGHRASGR